MSATNPEDFKPFVPASQDIPEFTPRAIILGSLFGVIFGAATVYLALRAGLTVSASVPIAVFGLAFPGLDQRHVDDREADQGRGDGDGKRHAQQRPEAEERRHRNLDLSLSDGGQTARGAGRVRNEPECHLLDATAGTR